MVVENSDSGTHSNQKARILCADATGKNNIN